MNNDVPRDADRIEWFIRRGSKKPLTAREIAEHTGIPLDRVSGAITYLNESGSILRAEGNRWKSCWPGEKLHTDPDWTPDE